MGQVLGIVIPLALGAAISPTVLTLQLVTLSGRTAPLTRGWAMAAGYGLVLAGEIVFALGLAASTGGSDTPSETAAAVKLVAAIILAGLGVRALTHAPKPEAERDDADSDRPRLPRYLAIGAVLMITNVTTSVLFIPAIHDVGTSDVEVAGKAGAVALVFLITMLPAGGPPLAVTLLGSHAKRGLDALNRFTTRHKRAINAGICFFFAAFLGAASIPVLL